MDLFGTKRIAELEEKLDQVTLDRNYYMTLAQSMKDRFDEIAELKESIPEDCTSGVWCRACEFGKEFRHPLYCSSTIVCAKGKSCPNFIQKKEND